MKCVRMWMNEMIRMGLIDEKVGGGRLWAICFNFLVVKYWNEEA